MSTSSAESDHDRRLAEPTERLVDEVAACGKNGLPIRLGALQFLEGQGMGPTAAER